MKFYHIAELEQLSGVKAHTIRIWEKRYNIITPNRTDTNIRLYDDDQVRKLLNVSTLLTNGVKISKIAELSDADINGKIEELQSAVNGDFITVSYVNSLISAMLDFNEAAFEKAFAAAVTRFGMFDAMLKVFYPLLHKIGMMWATQNAMPVQEHFASSIIRRKLLSAIDGLPPSTKRTKRFLLMLPPDEWHEIGLLFSEFIVRSKGIDTIYLGQNVPYANIAEISNRSKITHVLLFFVSRRSDEELTHLRKKMELSADVKLLVAGNPDITALLAKQRHIDILESPDDLLNFL